MSTITITNALNALKGDGYLNRIKGKGSFIQLPVKSTGTIISGFDAAAEPYVSPDRDKMLGLVLEHVSSCFGLDMMYAMDAMAAEAGYKLCVRFSYGEREKETEEIEFLKELGVSGIIVMPCHGIYYNTAILKLVVEEFPMILIDKKMEGIPVPSVRTDNHLAMKELVDYLVHKGNKKIGFITFSENGTSSIKDRRKGFREAIKAAGVENMEECCLEGAEKINIYSDDIDIGLSEKIEQYLDDNKDLDAVICAEYGIARERIIAMQGPFSAALNQALFEQLNIKTLVTKDGGAAGGLPEKLKAAKGCGVAVILVRRPEETGDDFDKLKIK